MIHNFEFVLSYLTRMVPGLFLSYLTRMAAPDAFLQNCYCLGLYFLGLIFTAMANSDAIISTGVPLVSAAV